MTIGASIFLIAVGAILRYAVDVTVSGIEIQTIGLILMIAGVVGLVIGLFLASRSTTGPSTTTVRSSASSVPKSGSPTSLPRGR
jgi:membrane-bound ClpP family serine protease